LSESEIANFVIEADANKDGVIDYEEFIPMASRMLQHQSTVANSESSQPVQVRVKE